MGAMTGHQIRILLALALVTGCATAGTISGTPRVIDADTIQIANTRIRLLGVDAREARTPEGEAATLFMQDVATGKVTCQPFNLDRYGRTVATCTNSAGVDLGAALVEAGHAVIVERYLREVNEGDRLARYRVLQDRAQAAQRGIWE